MSPYPNLNEVHARIAQLISIATVIEVDCINARAKVNLNNVKSSWLPWLSSFAGKLSSWAPLEIGEQVVLLCPSGNLNQAVVLRGLHHQGAMPPSNSPSQTVLKFKDGSSVRHDSASSTITISTSGAVIIKSANSVEINSKNIQLSASNVTIDAGNLKVTGNIDVDGGVLAQSLTEKPPS